ncbi:MAG: hypothetical protein GTO24_12835 [candidate division Zixibacteria bacterium]|nr:hypothetical protein [candidate division Zixibacteria bacterium]
MKKLSLFAVALTLTYLFICNFAVGATEVKVGKGDLKIGGILQAGFIYLAEDDPDDEDFDSFFLNRARFLFWGTIVPDKVKYFVQLDHRGGVSVLDYKAQFFYIPKTEIAVGRFLPNFTLYMPVSTAKLEMINYPLTTLMYAVWRQVGIQTTTRTDYVDFNFGVFNGYPANNFSDENDAKDLLFRVDLKPGLEDVKLRFGSYAWVGFNAPPDPGPPIDPHEETFEAHRFGGFATLDYTKDEMAIRFRGEFLGAQDEYPVGVDAKASWNSNAFFIHAGIQPVKQVEFLARYDYYDPDTDVDDNGSSWLTGGVNYYIDDINAMFYLNYIHMEDALDEDHNLVLGQVQITF